MTLYQCPKCHQQLILNYHTYKCINNHSYDIAKQSYVNLLLNPDKPSMNPGDAKASLIARRHFFTFNYYQPIIERLDYIIKQYRAINILDIGSGEGYYLSTLKTLNHSINAYGFDISKDAIKMACQYNQNINWFVANATNIPIQSNQMDLTYNAFSIFKEDEVFRLLKDNGIFVLIRASENHLKELKALIYNDVTLKPLASLKLNNFNLIKQETMKQIITLDTNEVIMALLEMTPHYYRMPKTQRSHLKSINHLDLTIEVEFSIYQKRT